MVSTVTPLSERLFSMNLIALSCEILKVFELLETWEKMCCRVEDQIKRASMHTKAAMVTRDVFL